MAPVKPFWPQPSHPEIQEVIYGEDENGSSPPCTPAPEATYATVQTDTNTHLNLNSDLLYINHSCEPSLIFDPQNQTILTTQHGLTPGTELTFFYPSTEWHMSQPFPCACATPSCVGEISGAGQMNPRDLEGKWLSAHVRRGLEERERKERRENGVGNGNGNRNGKMNVVKNEEGGEERQREREGNGNLETINRNGNGNGNANANANQGNPNVQREIPREIPRETQTEIQIHGRRGVTSREMSGEMGGDTL
ncbi:hypothetical protein NHQ30_008802 [Ciborinia camelliae]|nr:hypothetical protein NHQ30_008802 [Ciborinia camelliae]